MKAKNVVQGQCPNCERPYSLTVLKLRRQREKREMNEFRLSNEKIRITNGLQKNSDRISSLYFVDGIPTKANPFPTMHMGYVTKRRKTRRPLFKQTLPTKKIRAEEGEMEIGINNNGSSHRRCSVTEGVLICFAKFTGKHLCKSFFFSLLKKRLWHRCSDVNFAKFLRTLFLQSTSGWLHL